MSYYRILVIGTVDVLETCTVWNTYQDLKLAGHAVELMDVRRYKGLLRDDGEPDENVLGGLIERFAPDYIACRGETADDVLAALAGTPAHDGPCPRHFLLFGFIGPGNFGDEFLTKTICEHLYERYPDCWVSIIGYATNKILARHGLASVRVEHKALVNAWLNGASALVFLGGIIRDDPVEDNTTGIIDMFLNPRMQIPGQTAMLELAYLHGVPAVFLGIGAGPLANPDSQGMVRIGSFMGPRYLTRDAATEQLLLDAGVDGALVSQKADLAWGARYPELPAATRRTLAEAGCEPGGYVVVSLREFETLTDALEQAVASTLDALYERTGLHAAFLAFAPSDMAVHERVIAYMAHPECTLLLDTDDFDATTGVIRDAAFTLAMRLHCSLIAAAQGVPCIGLDYNVKVAETFVQLGAQQLCLPMDVTAQSLLAACENVLNEREQLAAALQPVRQANGALVAQAYDELFAAIDAHEPHPTRQFPYTRCVSRETEQLRETRSTLAKERRAAARERKQLEKTKATLEKTRDTLAQTKAALAREREKSAQLAARLSRIENSRTWKLRCKLVKLLRRT